MKKSSVLIVAAHPDDEVLGCGGTIARFCAEGRDVHVLLLADGESSRDSLEQGIDSGKIPARTSSAEEAACILECLSVEVCNLPDNRLDSLDLLDIVRIIEDRVERTKAGTVFTHFYGDGNVDHRIVHEAVLAACRPQPGHSVKELFFFEVPSSTEWRPPQSANPFTPGLFVDITSTLEKKIKAMAAYKDELRAFPHPRSVQAIEALARWRGATCGVFAAEAFVIGRKII
jgi:N-acetylglucosamine malate deacetylase 1